MPVDWVLQFAFLSLAENAYNRFQQGTLENGGYFSAQPPSTYLAIRTYPTRLASRAPHTHPLIDIPRDHPFFMEGWRTKRAEPDPSPTDTVPEG